MKNSILVTVASAALPTILPKASDFTLAYFENKVDHWNY